METGDLPDAEFKTLFIKMLNDLSENFSKELGNIKMDKWIKWKMDKNG